jgi:hypothetical protein
LISEFGYISRRQLFAVSRHKDTSFVVKSTCLSSPEWLPNLLNAKKPVVFLFCVAVKKKCAIHEQEGLFKKLHIKEKLEQPLCTVNIRIQYSNGQKW